MVKNIILIFCWFVSIFITFCLAGSGENLTDAELLAWEPPAEILKRFPYYLIGHDKDGHPVFLVEFGKWDMRRYLENSSREEVKNFEKYYDQLSLRLTSPELIEPPTGHSPAEKFVVIADLDGYSLQQVTHAPSIQMYLYAMKQFVAAMRRKNINVRKGFFVNSNFVFQTVWNLLRPIFGETFAFMELFGTKSNKWKPALYDVIARDQLPEFLGGVAGHKPLKFYG